MASECYATKREKAKRVKDQPLNLFDGKLVNRKRLAELLHCPTERISKMIHLPNGLPHIRIGARLWFDPEAVLAWFKQHEVQKNQSRPQARRN